MRKSLSVLLLSIISAFIFGCSPKEETSSESEKFRIAVIPKAESHIFWKTCQAGALKAAQEFGVEVTWKGPDIGDDRNAQIQTIQRFVVKGVDAIAIAPVDGDVLTKPVEQAAQDGIKMIVFDSGLKRHDQVESFVATDNYQGGVLCAHKMAELLGAKGKVIMLRVMEGGMSTTKRESGFLATIKEIAPDIELISTSEYGGASVGSAQKKAQLLLNKYADTVDGIFTPNENTTEGMLLALQQQGLAGKVKFVGFDANQPLIDGMEKNILHALAVQNPFEMGYLSVKAAYQSLKGETVEHRIDTGVTIITPENMDTPESQHILSPDIDKWINL
jgi:ribose transport system substrate-binding protein